MPSEVTQPVTRAVVSSTGCGCGCRPIHDAVEHDQVEMVRLLLSCGADTSLSTYSGSTLFTIANSKEMKQFLHGMFVVLSVR